MFSLNVGNEGERENTEDELRLVLIGQTGSGNTILRQRQFLSELKASSVTQVLFPEVEEDKDCCRRKNVLVVDMPGFGDTRSDPNQVHSEIAKCVTLSARGPHAFLLVIQLGRYTEDEARAAREMLQMFGESALQRHTVLVFTHGDDLEEAGGDMESFLGQDAPEALRALVDNCGGRYHVLNNKQPENRKQVRELLRKVEKMVEENRGQCYTSPVFQEEEERLTRVGGQKSKERGMKPHVWLIRTKATHSPNNLERIKVLLKAGARGFVVGAVLGYFSPFAFAAGASVFGTSLSPTRGLAGKTAFVFAVTGSVAWGRIWWVMDEKAAKPREEALKTLEQVGLMGAIVLGGAAFLGGVGAWFFGASFKGGQLEMLH